VSFFPADGQTPVILQKSADIPMYRAKARGRNCIEFFALKWLPSPKPPWA